MYVCIDVCLFVCKFVCLFTCLFVLCLPARGRRGGEVARTLASHQCDLGSTPDLGSM